MVWVILGIIAVVVVWLVIIYNRLVSLRQVTGQSWSDVDVQLKQRHDLIPNLVETVKGYATHEKSTLDAVIAARNAAQGATGVHDKAAAEQQLSGAVGRLLALGEAYPDLKASGNFQSLQHELADVEDKLAAARRALNAATARFNAARESFPAVLFAGLLGFGEADFNRLDDSEKGTVDQTPRIAF